MTATSATPLRLRRGARAAVGPPRRRRGRSRRRAPPRRLPRLPGLRGHLAPGPPGAAPAGAGRRRDGRRPGPHRHGHGRDRDRGAGPCARRSIPGRVPDDASEDPRPRSTGSGRIDEPPPAVGTALPRRGWVRAALAGVAVFVLCVAIGFATVRWRGGAVPAVASDRSSVVTEGQVRVHALRADVNLVEVGADRRPGSPCRRLAELRRARIGGAAALRRHHHERGRRQRRGRLAHRRRPGCGAGPRAVRPGRLVGARGGRAGRRLRARPRLVVADQLDGRPTWQISTTVAQVSELLTAFRTGLTWRPLDTADRPCSGSTATPACRCGSR